MSITPGPWKLETAPGGPNEGWTISVEKARDASLKGYRYIILAQRSAIPGEEFAANARAFAEVPNLMGLLADLVAGEDIEPIKREARAVLRRIEGEF